MMKYVSIPLVLIERRRSINLHPYIPSLLFTRTTLCPAEESGKPSASLSQAIDSSFGDIEAMKACSISFVLFYFIITWGWVGLPCLALAHMR